MAEQGRPSKLTDEQKENIRKYNAVGDKQEYIASLFKVSRSTINRICRKKK
jgi:transposase